MPRTSSFIPNFHEMCLVRLLFRSHQTGCDSPTNKLLLSGTRLPSWRLERIEHGVQLPSSCRLVSVWFFVHIQQSGAEIYLKSSCQICLFSNVYTSISDPNFWTPTDLPINDIYLCVLLMPSLYIPSNHSRWLQRPQHYRLPLLGLPPPLAAGSCSENQTPNRGRYISPLNITKTKLDDHHLEHPKLLKGKYSKPWSTPPKKKKRLQ